MSGPRKAPRIHVDPGMLQRMADAYLSRPEIARILKLTEGTLSHRLKRHSVLTKGDQVKREREWLHEGRVVMREPWGDGKWVWINPARTWSGPKMQPEYLEALLEHGFLERLETVGTVAAEHYRHVKSATAPEGDG